MTADGLASGRLAALFPGQGSQAVGMARELYEGSAAARAVLDEAEAALPGLLVLMWDGPAEELQRTMNQQPALVAAGAAAFAAYREAGGRVPEFAAGHSLGEFTAHVAAGSLSVADAVRLVRKRGTYMQDAVAEGEGAMAAVLKLPGDEVRAACDVTRDETGGVVEVANLNSPEQTVISGSAGAVAAAGERLKASGARVVPLKVSAPFHCSLMRPAAERLAADLAGVSFGTPAFPVVANVTADLLDARDVRQILERQVTSPVRWTETMQRLEALGVTRFVEFGSGKVLTNLVARTLSGVDAVAVTDMASVKEAV